jgi:hypothetical protein
VLIFLNQEGRISLSHVTNNKIQSFCPKLNSKNFYSQTERLRVSAKISILLSFLKLSILCWRAEDYYIIATRSFSICFQTIEKKDSFILLVVSLTLIMSSSWGEWFEDARNKTKEFAEKAQVIAEAASKAAQEKAVGEP